MGTVNADVMTKALDNRLKKRAPELGVKKILDMKRSPGGLSSENYFVFSETKDGPLTWVLRMEPPGGVLEPYDVAREYRILKALETTGIPVPRCFYVEEDPQPLGGRFFLMEFVEGDLYVHSDPRFQDETVKIDTHRRFVELLAELHTTPPPEALLPPIEGLSYAQSEVLRCKQRLEEVELLPRPLLRYVIKTLEEHALDNGPQVIVHGDFRLSNMIWRGGKIVGLLDWERARLGDPLSDVAFSLIDFLHGWCSVTGDCRRLYTDITGFEIDEQRLAFFLLLEFVKVLLVGVSSPSTLIKGPNADLRLLSVGFTGMSLEPLSLIYLERLLTTVKGR